MNIRRVIQSLQLVFYTVRIGQMLGAGRLGSRLRSFLSRNRLAPFWVVAVAAFVVPWGSQHFPATQALASAGDECRVIRIVDGDGMRLDCGPGRENLNVRMYCIDAPETDQAPWGDRSTEHLIAIAGDRVRLVDHGTGRWGRTIGQVFTPDGVDLNRRMVTDGWAAVYPQYCDDRPYYRAERDARKLGIGIWSEPGGHQRPWAHR